MLLSSFLPFRSLSLPLLADASMKLGNKWFSEQHKQITIKTTINTGQNQKPMRMGKRRSNRIVPRVESRNCWINVGRSKSRTPGSDGASHRPSRVEAIAAPSPFATVSPGDGTPLGRPRAEATAVELTPVSSPVHQGGSGTATSPSMQIRRRKAGQAAGGMLSPRWQRPASLRAPRPPWPHRRRELLQLEAAQGGRQWPCPPPRAEMWSVGRATYFFGRKENRARGMGIEPRLPESVMRCVRALEIVGLVE